MMTKITIFTGKTCPRCPAAKAVAQEVAKETGAELEILDIEEHMITALQNQIASVPSIMVDDETVFRGQVPTKEELAQLVRK
jgi:glutaredoxin